MTTPNNTVAGLPARMDMHSPALVIRYGVDYLDGWNSAVEAMQAALASHAPSATVGVEEARKRIVDWLADHVASGPEWAKITNFVNTQFDAITLPAAPSAPDIDAMVNRFLCWKLPDDFGPDAGVSFVPPLHPHGWPTGTNLLTAVQARAMFEHCMASAPSGVDLCEVARELERVHAEKVITDVAAIAGDRTDAYWSGHSQACEEIAHRLGLAPAALSGVSVPPSAPPSVAGDAGELLGYDSAESRDKAIARMVHDFHTLAAFHSKHAMESKLPASCLCCGHSMDGRKAVIQHAELPNIVICEQCRRLATAEQPGSAVLAVLPHLKVAGADWSPMDKRWVQGWNDCAKYARECNSAMQHEEDQSPVPAAEQGDEFLDIPPFLRRNATREEIAEWNAKHTQLEARGVECECRPSNLGGMVPGCNACCNANPVRAEQPEARGAMRELLWMRRHWRFDAASNNAVLHDADGNEVRQWMDRVDALAAAPSGVRVDDAMVERALTAYYRHGAPWRQAAKDLSPLVTETTLRDDMRAALTAALSANEVSRG